jgi:hypothetical protein
MVSPLTLPAVEGWPYQEVSAAFIQKAHTGEAVPKVLMVGYSLWALLLKASDTEVFYVCGTIPIRFERSGILEPHEFMFTRD